MRTRFAWGSITALRGQRLGGIPGHSPCHRGHELASPRGDSSAGQCRRPSLPGSLVFDLCTWSHRRSCWGSSEGTVPEVDIQSIPPSPPLPPPLEQVSLYLFCSNETDNACLCRCDMSTRACVCVSAGACPTNHCPPFCSQPVLHSKCTVSFHRTCAASRKPHTRLCRRAQAGFGPDFQHLGAVDFHCFGS